MGPISRQRESGLRLRRSASVVALAIIALGMLALPSPAHAATYSSKLVQNASGAGTACTGGTCILVAFVSNVAAGDLLVGVLSFRSNTAACPTYTGGSDSLGSAISLVTSMSYSSCSTGGGSVAIIAGYAKSSGSDTLQVAYTGTLGTVTQSTAVFEMSGVSLVTDGVGTNSFSTATSAYALASALTYGSGDFLVAATAIGTSRTTTVTTGFTAVTTGTTRTNSEYEAFAASSGTSTFSMTLSGTSTGVMAAVAFQALGATPSAMVQNTSGIGTACTGGTCTLVAYASNVAAGDLLVGVLMITSTSATCPTYTGVSDTQGSSLSIITSINAASCSAGGSVAIVAGYAMSSAADTLRVTYTGTLGTVTQFTQVFELTGITLTIDGIGSNTFTASTAVALTSAISYGPNDFAVAAYADGTARTLSAVTAGYTAFRTSSARDSGEYNLQQTSGTTAFGMTLSNTASGVVAGVAFAASPNSNVVQTAASSTLTCSSSPCGLVAYPNAVTSGNLLVGVLELYTSGATCPTFSSASDSLGSSISVVVSKNAASCANGAVAIVAGYAASAGSDTLSVAYTLGSGTISSVSAFVFELNGVTTATAGTGTNTFTASTAVATSGAVSYTAGDFLVAGFADGTAGALTPTSGFTHAFVATAATRLNGEYDAFPTSSGSTTFSMTIPSATGAVAAVAFKHGVLQPIGETVSPSGAPTGTIAVSGCNVTPSTIPGDGAAHGVFATPSCALTLTATAGTNQRYGYSIAGSFSSSVTFSTCSSGPCAEHDDTYYDQVSNAYWAAPHVGVGGPTFSASITFVLTGTFLGSGGTICTITLPASPAAGNGYSCSGYSDYNTAVSFPSLSGANPLNTRWAIDASAAVAYSDTTGGNAHPNGATSSSGGTSYDEQFSNTYQASTSGGGPPLWDSGLSITPIGTSGGVASSSVCTITPTSGGTDTASCSGYSDYNTAVTAPSLATGSVSPVQWKVYGTSSYTDTSGGTTHAAFTYYKQLQNTYQVSAIAQANFDAGMSWPVTGTIGGLGGSTGCTIASSAATTDSCSGYFDYNLPVTIPQGASTPPANARWQSSASCSFTQTTGGNTDNCNSYKQWSTSFQVMAASSGTFTSGATFGITYKSLGVSGGGSCTITATAANTASTGCTNQWIDDSGTASYPGTAGGSSPSNGRWVTGTGGVVGAVASSSVTSGGTTVNQVYYEQWTNNFAYTAPGTGTFNAPLLYCNELGVNSTTALSASPAAVWCDNGSTTWSTNPLSGSGSSSTERGDTDTARPTITSGGSGATFVYYHQYSQSLSYNVNDGGSGYGAPATMGGQQFGVAYNPTLPTSATVYWFDATGTLTFTNPLSGSGSAEQWVENSISVSLASSNTQVVQYYHQYTQTLSYSVVYGGSPSAPTASGLQYGSPYAPSLTTSASAYWFDATGTIAFSTPAGTNERWAPGPSGVSATSSNTQVASMYNQYSLTYSYSISGGGSGYSAPGLSCTELGSSYTPSLTGSATPYWCDNSQPWAVSPNPLTGSGSSERWYSPQTLAGTVSSALTAGFTFYDQYSESSSYTGTVSVSGAPSLVCVQAGSPTPALLSTSPTSVWCDASGSFAIAKPGADFPSSDERYETVFANGTISSSGGIDPAFYHQFEASVSYSEANGGTPTGNALVLSYSYFGNSGTICPLTGSGTPEWIDASSPYAVGDHYVSSTERYSQDQNGTLSGAGPIIFEVYHQFAATSAYSGAVAAGGAPSLSGAQFGTTGSATLLTTSPASVWLDSGSGYAVTKPSADFPSSTERYETSFANGTVGSAVTVNPAFYHQFDVPASFTTSDSSAIPGGDGSVTLTAAQFGGTLTPVLATAATGYWLDSGSSWTVGANVLPSSPTSERWDANSLGLAGTVSSSSVVDPEYLHQYLLTVTGGDGVTYGTASPTSDDWFDAGTSTTVSSNWAWDTVSGQSRTAVTDYQVDGVNQSPARAGSGELTTASVTLDAAHTVAFVSTTQYYLTVSGGHIVSYGTASPTGDNWYDSGSSTTVASDGVYGRASGSGQRVSSWNVDGGADTDVATAGTVTTSAITMGTYHTAEFNFVTQYLLTDEDPSGAETSVTPPAIPGDTGWYDSGTSVTIALDNVYGLVPGTSRNDLVSYTQGATTTPVARSGSGTATEPAIVMSAPTTVWADYAVQYYLALSTDCFGVEVSAISPTGDGWYDSGTSLDVQCGGVGDRTGGMGKRAQDYYWDSGSPTVEATTGTYTTASVTMSSAHTLNVDAVAQFQVAFAASPTEGGGASSSTSPPINGDAGWYDSGSVIYISATPSAYWSFSSWSASTGSITLVSTSSASTKATVNASGTITAEFAVTTPLSAGGITPVSSTIDQGQSITLTANPSGGSGSYAYQWYTSSDCSSPVLGAVGANYSASPPSSTTYYYEVTDSTSASACSAGDALTVDAAPTVSVSPTSVTLDRGQSVSVTATPSSGTGSFGFAWSVASGSCPGFSDSGAATLIYTPSGTTNNCEITLTLTDTGTTGGASPLSTATPSTNAGVTVDPALSVAVSPMTVDSGQAGTLTAAPSGGSGSYAEYDWYLGASCTGSPLQTGVSDSYATGALSSTADFCVLLTDSVGGTATSSVTIDVNPLLSLSVPPVSVDSGQAATLTAVASGGSGSYALYAWYTGANCTGTPLRSGASDVYTTVALTANADYCVAVTDSLGGAATTSATVTVNPTLSVSISPVTIDSGQQASLTAVASGGSGAYVSYAWYLGASCNGSLLQSGGSASYQTPALTSNARHCVQVTDSLGVTASSTVTVTVNSPLAVDVSGVTIDSGQAATLTAVPSGGSGSYTTFAWYLGDACSGTPLQSGASSSYTTPALTSNTDYCAQVTDSLAGSATTTATVTITGSLSVSVPPVTIDSGQTATLSAAPSGGSGSYPEYDWYLGASCTGGQLQTGASGSYTTTPLTSDAVYCIVVIDSLGGNATTTATVTVNAFLSLSVSPVSVDSDQTASLTAVASGGSGVYASFAWYLGASCTGTPLQTGASGYATAALSSTTGYCVQVTDSLGGTAVAGVTVTVNPTLSLSVSPVSVDSGQAGTLTAVASGGSGSYAGYDWYAGSACTGTPLQSGATGSYTTTALSSGTEYCVAVTDSLGGSAIATATVTVNPALAVAVSPVTVDSGQTATLTAVATDGSGAYALYAWFSGVACTGTPLQSGSSPVFTSAALDSGASFCVKVTDSLGGTATAIAAVTVDPALVVPTPEATDDPAYVGQTVTFSVAASGGSGAGTYSYLWNGLPPGSCGSDAGASVTCTLSTATGSPLFVEVAVTDSNGNTLSAGSPLSFTVYPALSAGTISSSTGSVVDAGQATTLSTAGASGGAGGYHYAWTNLPEGCLSSDLSAVSCTPADATGSPFTVTLTVTDANGYAANATLNLGVNPPLEAPAISVAQATIDPGQNASLSTSSSFSGGTSPYSCQWLAKAPGGGYLGLGAQFSCGAGDAPTVSTGTLSAPGTWHFELLVTDGAGASAASNEITVAVVVPTATSVSVACAPSVVGPGQSVRCTATATGSSPTGTVSFSASAGSFLLLPTCTLASGRCSVTFVSPSGAGSVTITGLYSGDTGNAPSSGASSVSVPAFSLAVPGGAPGASVTGPTGSPVTLAGSGFGSSSRYYFCFEAGASSATGCASNQHQLVTDSSGAIPSSTTLGGLGATGVVVVYDPLSGAVVGSAQYTAVAPSSGPSAPSIAISPPTGTVQSGSRLTVTGANFAHGATISLSYSGGVIRVDSGTITASSTGGFTATLTVLAGQPGSWTLTAVGSDAPSDAASAPYALVNVNNYVSTYLTVPASGTIVDDQTATIGASVTMQNAPNAGGQVILSDLSAPGADVTATGLAGAKYFDILAVGLPDTATATVCFTDSSITSSTVLYWAPSGGAMATLPSSFTSPDTVCTDPAISVSQLSGTNFATAAPQAGQGGGVLFVSQSIRLSEGAGSAPVTFSLTGCGVIPSEVVGDGQAHHISAYPDCTVSVSAAALQSDLVRYVFADGNQSILVSTCGGLGCSSTLNATYYEQVLQTLSYSVIGGAGGYGAPTIAGLWLGSTFSAALTATQTGYWLDANGGIAPPSLLPGSGANERWSLLPSSAEILSADVPNSAVLVYVHQYAVDIAVSPVGAGTTTPSGLNWFDASSAVTISAMGGDGFDFSGWVSGSGNSALRDQASDTTTATVNGPDTLTATFVPSSTSTTTSTTSASSSTSTSTSTSATSTASTSAEGNPHSTTSTATSSTSTSATSTGSATGNAPGSPPTGVILAGLAAALAAAAFLVLPKTRKRRSARPSP